MQKRAKKTPKNAKPSKEKKKSKGMSIYDMILVVVLDGRSIGLIHMVIRSIKKYTIIAFIITSFSLKKYDRIIKR